MPSCISIGTKIGASSAHFADAEPMSRLTSAVRKMIPTMVTWPGRASALSAPAPFSASSAPMFDWPKAAMKSAAKKASTKEEQEDERDDGEHERRGRGRQLRHDRLGAALESRAVSGVRLNRD